MKTKFTYTGIRVKDLGRSTVDATKGRSASLATEEDGFVLELNHYERGSRFATDYVVGEGLDHLAFQVENLDKALEEAKKAGHPVVLEMKTPTSRWAYIADPNGIWIELFV